PKQDELRELLNVIKDECYLFLKLKGYGIQKNTAVLKDTELTIHIADKEHYHDFILHLAKYALPLVAKARHLLKAKQQEMQDKKIDEPAQKEKEKYSSPSPYKDMLKGPKPKGVKRQEE